MGFPRDFLVLLAIPVVLRWRCYCPLEGICKCAGEFRLVTVTGDPEGIYPARSGDDKHPARSWTVRHTLRKIVLPKRDTGESFTSPALWFLGKPRSSSVPRLK